MIDLGIGQPQLALLPHAPLQEAAARTLTGHDNSCLNYGPARGNGYFLAALAEFLTPRYGCAVDPFTLMATGGCTQALDMVTRAFAQPGDTILVEEPTYFLASRIFADCGLQVVGVPLGPRGLEPDTVEAAILRHKPKLLYIIPVHQNPSGVTLAQPEREALVDLCVKHGVMMIADEVYQLLTYQGSPPPPMAAYIDSQAVISLGSFSKILAPGLRLGWLQAAPKPLQRLTQLGTFASGGGVNHFTGCIVKELLQSGDQARYLESLITIFRHRVALMDRLLQEHLGERVSYRCPDGGYFFWLRLQDGSDAREHLLSAQKQKVGFRAGQLFSSGQNLDAYLRLSFAHYGDTDIEQGIERLSRALP